MTVIEYYTFIKIAFAKTCKALDIWEVEVKFKNNPAIAPATKVRHSVQ